MIVSSVELNQKKLLHSGVRFYVGDILTFSWVGIRMLACYQTSWVELKIKPSKNDIADVFCQICITPYLQPFWQLYFEPNKDSLS
jgi:hypothetical protein